MAFDLHVHRALVQEAGWRGTVGADRPRAVVKVPRAFVAEKNLERIGGRTLEVVRPVVFAMDDAEGAGFELYSVDHFWGAGGPLGFESATAATRGRRARDRLAVGIGRDANEERFVAVDRVLAAADAGRRGELRDFADRFRVEVDGNDCISAARVGFARAPRGGDHAGISGDDIDLGLVYTKLGKIHGGDAFGGVEDEFISLGRVAVLVKVETGAASVRREPDDAMARVGVYPI